MSKLWLRTLINIQMFMFPLFVWITWAPRCDAFKNVTIESKPKIRHNISRLLDTILDDYNYSLRPDVGGPATEVDVDIMVRSMGPISEADMTFSMDCYFRQTWKDTRLSHEHSSGPLALSVSTLNRIWKPDTYFYNGKNSYLHTITTPNKLVRLFPDGRILYSSRLTIKASCPMHLQSFPMDYQLCPLNLGSFAYTQTEIKYRWNTHRQVAISSDMKMSQFDLISTPVTNYTLHIINGNYSMLSAQFNLRRHMGSFLIQVYGPCILLVVLSWVSFWINREATADRISLGVTTVLTMTFLGLEARATLPKVSYPTALDHFIFLSFGFIFATILQFAFVHYYTKIGYGEVYYPEDQQLNRDNRSPARSTLVDRKVHPQKIFVVENHVQPHKEEITIQIGVKSEDANRPNGMAHPWDTQMNSVSKIDKISRVVFPVLFLTINLFYWYIYLVLSE